MNARSEFGMLSNFYRLFESIFPALDVFPSHLHRHIDEYMKALRQEGNLSSEEEMDLTSKLKEYKEQYRSYYSDLEEKKSELQYLSGSSNAIKSKMLSAYEEWLRGSEEHESGTDSEAGEIPSTGKPVETTSNSSTSDARPGERKPYDAARYRALNSHSEKEQLRRSNRHRKEWKKAF
eukprot:gb/GECG01010950.1/.p1 GENE.gb/GECG01010950.1/~~gb/GECG01010950.1/.p1  ORF type:complete len:178 (+),score=36.00 gb/GECG01010950.1/:1-534(+)